MEGKIMAGQPVRKWGEREHPAGPWMTFVIHPETGTICSAYGSPPYFWPEDGFQVRTHGVHVWPVPNIKGARLVTCHCGKAGIQARTPNDAMRYIPGAVLSGDTITLGESWGTYTLPAASGEDEVPTLRDKLRKLVAEWREAGGIHKRAAADELEEWLDE